MSRNTPSELHTFLGGKDVFPLKPVASSIWWNRALVRKGKCGSQYQDLSSYLSRDFNPEDLSIGGLNVKQGLKVTILQYGILDLNSKKIGVLVKVNYKQLKVILSLKVKNLDPTFLVSNLGKFLFLTIF